ncbi:MAG: hypothetical protein CMB18_01150 [Euryarchaeota archaeon]|nr:hypothetical protein [Euryarchaeota archaeon]
MSELSGHDCPRCNVELYIETSGEIDGVDLLICKQCWGVGVIAKSMEMVFGSGNNLEQKKDYSISPSLSYGACNCPLCRTEMDEIELEIPDEIKDRISLIDGVSNYQKVIIDSCNNCSTVWFDAGELDLLNGIKPKLRGGAGYDPKMVRLLEDQNLTEQDMKRKRYTRIGLGLFAIFGAVMIGMDGSFVLQSIMGLVGLGGLIAIFTKSPEVALSKGTCDKCLKPNKSLAWNCQSGGCWAHICSDCQSVGDDPVEAYAKTLGQVAVGAVVVGVAVVAIVAVAESGVSPSFTGLGAGGSDEKKNPTSEKKKNSLLLCKECIDRE